MATTSREDKQYKHDDYAVRSNDAYALSKYQVILNWLPRTEGFRVLNAGCGSGEMSALLALRSSWQVDAFDVDPDAIHLSHALNERLGLTNIHLYEADIESHSGRDYDIVVCNDVLEHLADDANAVGRLAHMLKPGGILCISVPALQWLFGYHDRQLGHFRRYNRHTLMTLLSPDVTVKRCRYFGCSLIPVAVWYSLLAKKNYPVSESMGMSLRARVLNACLKLEQQMRLPWGTSLLALGVAPEQSQL